MENLLGNVILFLSGALFVMALDVAWRVSQ